MKTWSAFWGELWAADDCRVLGLDSCSGERRDSDQLLLGPGATTWGFVQQGQLDLEAATARWQVGALQWFCMPLPCRLSLAADSRAVLVRRYGYRGLQSMGGPVESAGRLRYIDGCSDTLLCPPPRQGDPCLNLLHFPAQVRQTMHTHPSLRAGMVARGDGIAISPTGETPLSAGMVFVIPADTPHRFVTDGSPMDVIAWHPDSDWGPRDECHPMLNRTWVDHRPIDNTGSQHVPRALISGVEDP